MKVLFISEKDFIEKYTSQDIFDKYPHAFVSPRATDEEVLAACPDCDVIICDAMAKVSANVINSMSSLKLIHSNGVGYQGVDVAAATAKGVTVCNCKGINATAVAEHTVMLMLAVLKDIVNNDAAIRDGNQIGVKRGYMARGDLKELGECTIGLVGFGDIGKSLRLLLRPFGCRVVYYDVFRQSAENEEKYNAEYMPMDDLLATSDIVSLHVPVFDSTRNMANDSFFAKMKQGAYLINTARGELCDSAALLRRIECGHIAGAGLDCIPDEPVSLDNAIFASSEEVQKKIIYSPHIAGITKSTFIRGFATIWQNVANLEAGLPVINIVNK